MSGSGDCSKLPIRGCNEVKTYIYITWGLGPLMAMIIVILAIGCVLLYTRLRKTLQDTKHTKNREHSGEEIQLEDGGMEQNHKPSNNIDHSTTIAEVNYETVGDTETPTTSPQFHNDSGQNYEYMSQEAGGGAKWVPPGNNTGSWTENTKEPLPYEDFVHGGGQDTTARQRQGSNFAVESSNERYSRLIHLPEMETSTGPNYYNTKTSTNRHSSRLLSTPSNEQESPQYGKLEVVLSPPPLPPPFDVENVLSPPPLPPPFDVENDGSFFELKFNNQDEDARESFYCNVSRKSVAMETEVAEHNDEEVFYCNTAPEVERIEHSLSVDDIESSEALYEEAMPLNLLTQELYINVKRS